MKNREQQKKGGKPKEGPANPTSPAARLDNAVYIIGHETPNLAVEVEISTAVLGPASFWTKRSGGLVCRPFVPSDALMTPEKFFDYLEGKMPPAEKERLERALIADPELQQQLASARQIHRGMQRPAGESAATGRAGNRGRQLAAAFVILVAMNVALGLIYIFRANKPSEAVTQARTEALRHQLQSSVEKAAAAAFTPPTLGLEQITIAAPRAQQEEAARTIIAAAARAGGSATKDLPNENGFNVLVLIPASAEPEFREVLHALGAPPTATAGPAASPNDIVRLTIVLASPR